MSKHRYVPKIEKQPSKILGWFLDLFLAGVIAIGFAFFLVSYLGE